MDPRWWIGIGVALFLALAGYIWLKTPQELQPTVRALEGIAESRLKLARTSASELEYRKFLTRVIPYFRESAHEFSYVLRGRAVGFLKNQEIEVQPGYLLVIPRRTALGLRVISPEPLELLSVYAPAPTGLDEIQVLIGDIFPPGDPSSLHPHPLPIGESDLQPHLVNLGVWENKELPRGSSLFEWTYLARSTAGSVALVRVRERLQFQKRSPHFLYIRRGRARITVGEETLEATAGQVAILPNVPTRIMERVGEELLEFLLFSAPPLRAKDIF
ncbi:MAG: cupin domain-containing protein [Candidatus Bipolaricaulota bacterium]|nr:cupin domain-containing protein [Candidatus Bipolaricaulota bacterium]MDW8031481.1 cupin domain-containing protein [Candidatus Bipolaricaulota bacterium]